MPDLPQQFAMLQSVILALLLSGQATVQSVMRVAPSLPLPEGSSSISGRVLDAETGQPLQGVRVRLTATIRGDEAAIGARPQQGETKTDSQGRYHFARVADGFYLLGAEHRGYVMAMLGSPNYPRSEHVWPVHVNTDQHAIAQDLTLRRGASIHGRVRDESGRGISNARVVAIENGNSSDRRVQLLAVPAVTDDEGYYAIDGIPEGRVIVQAIPRPDPANPGAGSREYLASYFPAATDPADATPITIRGTQSIKGINLVVHRKIVHSVTGRILTAAGDILDATEVVLESCPAGTRYHTGGSALANGEFSFTELEAGRYILWARSPVADGFEASSLSLSLMESLTDVQLVLLPTGTIKGRVQAERGEMLPAGLSVVAKLSDGATEGSSADQSPIDVDGTFTLDRLFGDRILELRDLPDDWTIKSIVIGRSEVRPPHITIAPNTTTSNVLIVIGRR